MTSFPLDSSVSLKQSLSLLELEQQLSWIRAEVEATSERSLSWYLLADDENALVDQVSARGKRYAAAFIHGGGGEKHPRT